MTQLGSVLVTGCSSGLGRATALHLRSQGWRVIATARRDQDLLDLAEAGFETLPLDLDQSDSVQAAAERVLKLTDGQLTGVVNNAGTELLGALEDLDRSDLRSCFETNVFGTMELTSLLIPTFRARGAGRIVFISSSNSNGFAYPFMGPGNASKAALEVLAGTLRRELRRSGIHVSTVCPGELSTGLLTSMLQKSAHILSKRSPQAHNYELLKKGFQRAQSPDPAQGLNAHSLNVVVQAIGALLESPHPPRRVVAPFNAKLHYLAHAALPESLQDRLLFRRMKEVFGIHG